MTTTTTLSDDEIERAPEGSEAGRLAAAWWAWHDETSRVYPTMAEARAACGAWVRGESDEGPHEDGMTRRRSPQLYTRSRRYHVTIGAGGYHTWDVYLRARSRPEAERLALATLSDPEGVEARAELDTETDPRT